MVSPKRPRTSFCNPNGDNVRKLVLVTISCNSCKADRAAPAINRVTELGLLCSCIRMHSWWKLVVEK